jgi:hypothetical protein
MAMLRVQYHACSKSYESFQLYSTELTAEAVYVMDNHVANLLQRVATCELDQLGDCQT